MSARPAAPAARRVGPVARCAMAMALLTALTAAAAPTLQCVPRAWLNDTCLSNPKHHLGMFSAPTAADCCAHCSTAPTCKSWSHFDEDKCLTFTTIAPAKLEHGCTSGTFANRPPPPPPPPRPIPPPAPPGSRSVIMIAADDMRPELGCYGCTHMKTPHLDALAQDSLVFDRAYVAVAWCSPSRTALLTSRRADTSRTWSVVPSEYWRERGGNFTTLTQHFVERGFLTLGMGKIFHPGAASGNNDVQYSWSPESLPYDGGGTSCPTGGPDPAAVNSIPQPNAMGGPAMSPAANGDTALASCGVRTINQLAMKRKSGADKRPFFLAVGFHKPHIPWTVPQEFYDRYPLDEVALAPHPSRPSGAPAVALNNILSGYWSSAFTDFGALLANGSITKMNPDDNTTLDSYWSRRARQAYWGAISFTDVNLGLVLGAAKAAGLYDEAIVIFWGDHGYQLGDNDQWSKVTNFEHSARIPLLIKPAARTAEALAAAGKRALGLVESIDIFPSLVALAMPGTPPVPRCPNDLNASRGIMLCTDGVPSLATALKNPNAVLDRAAFSQVPRDKRVQGMSGAGPAPHEQFMGYSVRTTSWRYTEWHHFDPVMGVADWSSVVAKELYPHEGTQQADCSWSYEYENVAGQPEHASVEQQLAAQLRTIVSV